MGDKNRFQKNILWIFEKSIKDINFSFFLPCCKCNSILKIASICHISQKHDKIFQHFLFQHIFHYILKHIFQYIFLSSLPNLGMLQIIIYESLHEKWSFHGTFRNKKKVSDQRKKYFFSTLCHFQKPAYQVDNFKPWQCDFNSSFDLLNMAFKWFETINLIYRILKMTLCAIKTLFCLVRDLFFLSESTMKSLFFM